MSLLSETELAERAATTPDRIRELAAHGILQPDREGRYRTVDISRIRVAEALDRSGISLRALGEAIGRGEVSLDFLDHLWPDPGGYLPGRTFADVAVEFGLPWDLVESSHVRLGLPRPSPGDPIREDEQLLLSAGRVLMGAGLDEAAQVRFSRVMGENIRRLAEAQVHFFDQTVMQPMLASGMSHQQVWNITARMSPELTPVFEGLLLWLYRRQQEHYLLQDIVEHLEEAMDRAGLGRARSPRPPAIAFLDLSGFTALTEERGDAAAADLAAGLAELVQEAAHAYEGKLVKLLGDGVMFHFADPASAVRCALHMVQEAPRAGLPPAHVGLDAGPVVFQDGDYFGRTVNVAARVAGKAGPGQVLVTDAVVEAGRSPEVTFRTVGPFDLKGVARPLVLHEALVRGEAERGDRPEGAGSVPGRSGSVL